MASVDKVQCVKQARGDALSKVGLEARDVSIDRSSLAKSKSVMPSLSTKKELRIQILILKSPEVTFRKISNIFIYLQVLAH